MSDVESLLQAAIKKLSSSAGNVEIENLLRSAIKTLSEDNKHTDTKTDEIITEVKNGTSTLSSGREFICLTDYRVVTKTYESLWPATQRHITVSFINGTLNQCSKVEQLVKEWEMNCTLRFRFIPKGGVIRISFTSNYASWCEISVNALTVRDHNKPTMNLDGISLGIDITADDRHIILHEFGHVIGMNHWNKYPNTKFEWNRDEVNRYYTRDPYNWGEKKITELIFDRPIITYEDDQFDSSSIMLYHIPRRFKKEMGDEVIYYPTQLSLNDKLYGRKMYVPIGNEPAYAPLPDGSEAKYLILPRVPASKEARSFAKMFHPSNGRSLFQSVELPLTMSTKDYNIHLTVTLAALIIERFHKLCSDLPLADLNDIYCQVATEFGLDDPLDVKHLII